jgi:hypothetical protein
LRHERYYNNVINSQPRSSGRPQGLPSRFRHNPSYEDEFEASDYSQTSSPKCEEQSNMIKHLRGNRGQASNDFEPIEDEVDDSNANSSVVDSTSGQLHGC